MIVISLYKENGKLCSLVLFDNGCIWWFMVQPRVNLCGPNPRVDNKKACVITNNIIVYTQPEVWPMRTLDPEMRCDCDGYQFLQSKLCNLTLLDYNDDLYLQRPHSNGMRHFGIKSKSKTTQARNSNQTILYQEGDMSRSK